MSNFKLPLIILVCFVCGLFTSCGVTDDNLNEDIHDEDVIQPEDLSDIEYTADPIYVMAQYEKLVQSFSSVVDGNTVYAELYGGSYYGDDGMLHINMTADNEDFKQEIFEIVDSKVVVFDKVYYSLNYLMNVYELLVGKMADLSICGVGVSQTMNCVDVDVLTEESIDTVKTHLNDLNFDADCCNFNVGAVIIPILGDE